MKNEINSDEENAKEKRKHIVIKNSADLQRMKLEKLMKNPDKPVIIPERPKPRGVPAVPDFVRNVMGSSAGAGSGEFHVYRHLRRKEYARQKYMQEKAERERLDEEYHKKLEEHRLMAEAKTAKKRAKRLKRKAKCKNKKPRLEKKSSGSESEEDEELTEGEHEDKKNTNEDPKESQSKSADEDEEKQVKDDGNNSTVGVKEEACNEVPLDCDADIAEMPMITNEAEPVE
ncbi:PRKR-interacting protein 1 homolog [Coccinella septempunctata]|uniref:PRKR-interacting protein 1 homolog n=1 Tax=Coccinella septempunctata TaxID=41139 RepID=UPI001D06F7A6|nr:PRKR-interacting protein 1 homolog [Coccinella septempunctata]